MAPDVFSTLPPQLGALARRADSVRGKGGSGLWLVFELDQKRFERIRVADNRSPTDADAQTLLREARSVCPNARATP